MLKGGVCQGGSDISMLRGGSVKGGSAGGVSKRGVSII